MPVTFLPYDQTFVDVLRAGGPDSYGLPAERDISNGEGSPCRSCLCDIARGATMLICAGRPFVALQPYAETGPIFCAVTHVRHGRGQACHRSCKVHQITC